MKNAQVHRFADYVAVSLPGGETVYLEPRAAQAIAKAMNACARDIKAAGFTSSGFITQQIELKNGGSRFGK